VQRVVVLAERLEQVTSATYPCGLYVAQTSIAAGTYAITLTATP
jgi:hypothetical protein